MRECVGVGYSSAPGTLTDSVGRGELDKSCGSCRKCEVGKGVSDVEQSAKSDIVATPRDSRGWTRMSIGVEDEACFSARRVLARSLRITGWGGVQGPYVHLGSIGAGCIRAGGYFRALVVGGTGSACSMHGT